MRSGGAGTRKTDSPPLRTPGVLTRRRWCRRPLGFEALLRTEESGGHRLFPASQMSTKNFRVSDGDWICPDKKWVVGGEWTVSAGWSACGGAEAFARAAPVGRAEAKGSRDWAALSLLGRSTKGGPLSR